MNQILGVRRSKISLVTVLFMGLLGLALLGIGGLLAKDSLVIDESWQRVDGEVSTVDSKRTTDGAMYTPIISYVVDGRTFTVASSSSSSSAPRIGSIRQVAYDPANPEAAKVVETGGAVALLVLMPIIGLAIAVFGVVLYVRSNRRDAEITRLMQSGQKIQGLLADISTTGSRSAAYHIIVAATDPSGVVRTYRSDALTGIGALAALDFQQTPIPIDVYIDPRNHDSYYVDSSDLPTLTPEKIRSLVQTAQKNLS